MQAHLRAHHAEPSVSGARLHPKWHVRPVGRPTRRRALGWVAAAQRDQRRLATRVEFGCCAWRGRLLNEASSPCSTKRMRSTVERLVCNAPRRLHHRGGPRWRKAAHVRASSVAQKLCLSTPAPEASGTARQSARRSTCISALPALRRRRSASLWLAHTMSTSTWSTTSSVLELWPIERSMSIEVVLRALGPLRHPPTSLRPSNDINDEKGQSLALSARWGQTTSSKGRGAYSTKMPMGWARTPDAAPPEDAATYG